MSLWIEQGKRIKQDCELTEGSVLFLREASASQPTRGSLVSIGVGLGV